MTWKQAVSVLVLLVLTTGLVGALALVDARTEALAAEGRDLLSPGAVAVRATTADLVRRGPEFAVGTRAFRDVPGAPRARVAIVLHGDWSNVPPYSGIEFVATDVRQALVGSAVTTTVRRGVRQVDVVGASYDVRGSLGLGEESLLAQDVLIADPSAFAAVVDGRTVLDGPDVAARAEAVFGVDRVEVVDRGANRRTNVDFVTPLVLTLGLGVATMTSVVAGAIAARHEMDRARIRRMVGQRSSALVLRVLGVSVALALSALGITTAALSGPGNAVGVDVLSSGLPQCGVFVGATALATLIRRRSWN